MTVSRRLAAFGAALLAALALLTATAPAASAHAALVGMTPQDAAVAATAPDQVTLSFSEPVATGLGGIRVLDAAGDRADTGRVEQSGDAKTVHVALRSELDDGTYVVLWRVVSADSHPVSGSFSFSVGQATELSGYQGRTGPPPGPGLLLGGTRLLGFTGLLLWLGGALFCLLLWREGTAHRAVRTVLGTAAGLALGSAVAALLLQGPYAAGLGVERALDGGLLAEVLQTRFGVATGARVVVAALAVAACLLVRRAPRPALLALVGLGGAASVTFTAAGHAGVGALQPFAAILDTTHLLATSAWVGGLVVLALALRGRWDDAVAARVLPQWSRVATWAVGLLVASGLFAGYREVRTPEALATRYGGLLSLKVFLVVVMLMAGFGGREWVRLHYGVAPRRGRARRRGVDIAHAAAEGTTDEHVPPDAATVAILRRSVRSETILAGLVLAVTAVLVQTQPAAGAYAPPYSGTSAAGPYSVQADLYPARKGLNGLHVYTVGAHGHTEDVAEVTGTLTLEGGESYPVRPVRNSLGHYEDLTVVLPATGTYTLTLQVRSSDVDSYPTVQSVPVR
ncbi:MAG TPA: copper resistance protein CopC [Mycobacteriales bacterium]|jgi:copper transport protein|nr:copper resistance protein CopC [Mycobacteriales bacterium]